MRFAEMIAYRLQVAREILCRCVTRVRIFRETALDEPSERRRNRRIESLRLFANDRGERFRGGVASKRIRAAGHLVKDRAQRELIGSKVDFFASGLLRRHIAGGAEERAGGAVAFHRSLAVVAAERRELGQPEVENLHEAV